MSNLVWFHNDKVTVFLIFTTENLIKLIFTFKYLLVPVPHSQILNRYSSHEGTSVKTTLLSINVVHSKLEIWPTISNDSGEYTCRPLTHHEAVATVYVTNGRYKILLPYVFLCI